MKYLHLAILLLFLVSFVTTTSAQKDTTKLNQSVEVMKAYHPSMSKANKLNLLPLFEDTTRFTPEFKYSIESRPISSGFSASAIQAVDVNSAKSKELGIGDFKVGVGTSNSILGSFSLNVPKSQTGSFGLRLNHNASDGFVHLRGGDRVAAPWSRTGAGLYGTVNLGGSILSADLSYDRYAMNYYGYTGSLPRKIDSLTTLNYGLNQVYEKGNLDVAVRSVGKNSSLLKFNTGVRLGFFDTKTTQKEQSSGLYGLFDYDFGVAHGLLNLSFDQFTTEHISLGASELETTNKGWLRMAPSARFAGDIWTFRGGVKFVAVSDKIEGNTTKLYPDLEFVLNPVGDYVKLFAGVDGDLKQANYSQIALDNYWVDPSHNFRNTDQSFRAFVGLKGKISRELSYNMAFNYSRVKDLYFYGLASYASMLPQTIVYENKFKPIYDNGSIANLTGELSYLSNSKLNIIVKGNYSHYTLDALPFAPQKANLELSATTSFPVFEKLAGFIDLGFVGGRQALVYPYSTSQTASSLLNTSFAASSPVVFQIDPILQLNVGATYQLQQKLRLFGRVENLLNQRNEQWLGYSSQGIRLLVGISFLF